MVYTYMLFNLGTLLKHKRIKFFLEKKILFIMQLHFWEILQYIIFIIWDSTEFFFWNSQFDEDEKFEKFFYPIVLKVHNIRTTFSSHPLWESATPFFVVCCLEHRKNLLVYTVWIRKVWPREKKKHKTMKQIYEGCNLNYF